MTNTKPKSPNNNTKSNAIKSRDKFWGQPHFEGEQFSEKEFYNEFLQIYMYEPFLAGISMEMDKKPDINCDTAYVGFNTNTYELTMGYNPYFFRYLKSKHREGIVIHELYHIVLQHLFDRNVTDKADANAWNVGTDLAINSIIHSSTPERMPDLALIPGKIPSMCEEPKIIEFIKNSKPMQGSEFYFEGIKRIIDQLRKEAGEDGEITIDSLDDHSNWGNLPSEVKEQVKDKVRGLIEKAVQRADSKNSWGSVPLSMQEQIRKGLTSEVDWRSIMRQFFGTARSMERISTIKKPSKKLPGILPGVKRGTIAKFAFFIDQSGSMSDEDVALAFTEVEAASKETEIDVYNFDTEIDTSSHKLWKRGKKFEWSRTRCGGTDFDSVAHFVNKQENNGRWSGVCILTDGCAPNMGMVKKAKVMWVITPGGTIAAARPGDIYVQLKTASKNFQNV